MLCCKVCFAPRRLWGVYLCVNVGPWGLLPATLPAPFSSPLGLSVRECGTAGSASGQTACPVCPTLRQSGSRHSHVSPLCPVPVSAPPTGLDECLFFISLVSDFLAVDFLSVLVVRGGAVCLPTLPSWFSVDYFLYSCVP